MDLRKSLHLWLSNKQSSNHIHKWVDRITKIQKSKYLQNHLQFYVWSSSWFFSSNYILFSIKVCNFSNQYEHGIFSSYPLFFKEIISHHTKLNSNRVKRVKVSVKYPRPLQFTKMQTLGETWISYTQIHTLA